MCIESRFGLCNSLDCLHCMLCIQWHKPIFANYIYSTFEITPNTWCTTSFDIYKCVVLPYWLDAHLTIPCNEPVMRCLLLLLRWSKSFWIWKVFSYCTLILRKHVWFFTERYPQYDKRHITCKYLTFQPAVPSWLIFMNKF